MASTEFIERAREAGFGIKQCRRACAALGVKIAPIGWRGPWVYSLNAYPISVTDPCDGAMSNHRMSVREALLDLRIASLQLQRSAVPLEAYLASKTRELAL
jgi:DNA-binding transcriptional MerR regulator